MKITIAKHALITPLQQAAKAVPAKSAIPIMSGIYIQADKESLSIVGCDTSLTIKTEIAGSDFILKRPGEVVLPAKAITEIINRMPEKDIDIEVGDNFKTKISSAKTKMEVMGMDPAEYPELPKNDGATQFEIKGDVLKDMIKRSSIAVYKKEDNPILTGIKVYQFEESLRFASADKNRCAIVSEKIEGVNIERYAVVPSGHFNKINETISDKDSVAVSIGKTQLMASNGTCTTFSRLLEGAYPPIETLIKNQDIASVHLLSKDFTDALERALITAEVTSKGAPLIMMRIQENELIILSRSLTGETVDSVPLSNFTGSEMKVAFNGRYMLDALKAVDSEELQIRFAGEKAPIYISDGNEADALFIVLPWVTKEGDWK